MTKEKLIKILEGIVEEQKEKAWHCRKSNKQKSDDLLSSIILLNTIIYSLNDETMFNTLYKAFGTNEKCFKMGFEEDVAKC